MGRWSYLPIAAGMLLLVSAPAAYTSGTVELEYIGWTHLHKAAEEGSVEKIRALLFGGHSIDERINATREIGKLEDIAEGELEDVLEETEFWGKELGRMVKEAMNRLILRSGGKHSAAQEEKQPERVRRAGKDLAESLKRNMRQNMRLPMLKQIEGATALHIAAGAGRYEAARFLIERGADVNAQTEAGMRPIDFSAMMDRKRLLILLLDNGANPEQPSTELGFSSLHWAVSGNAVETTGELLSRGAPVNAKNNEGFTPMDIAHTHRHSYLLQTLLMEHGGHCAKNCPCERGLDNESECQPQRSP